MKKLIYLLSLLLPWTIRRQILRRVFRFDVHPTSRVGLSWVMPERLTLGEGAWIGHFTVCRNLEHLSIGKHASLGNGNWVYGFSHALSQATGHFLHQEARVSQLVIEDHAAITHRHIIDCTHTVLIGRFSTVAGYHSQILTHSIDLEKCRQDSQPIQIGEYCLLGTNAVVLGGSTLPDYCVLGAKSLLNKAYTESHTLYAGLPAKPVRQLSPDAGYFKRKTGKVT